MSIPFNKTLWERGRKVQYRNGEIPAEIFVTKLGFPISVEDTTYVHNHDPNGDCPSNRNYDLVHPDEEMIVDVVKASVIDGTYKCVINNPFIISDIPPGKYKLVRVEEK